MRTVPDHTDYDKLGKNWENLTWPKLRILTLNLKAEYFNAIKTGTKTEEYRLFNDFWRKRLENKEFDAVCICLGYPKKDDTERRLTFPWNGYAVKTISHPHFGSDPVKVFAIRVNET